MLGRTLASTLSAAGHTVAVADLPEVDITRPETLSAAISGSRPDTLMHCAAMTKVDDCESNRDLAFLLNETGSRNVAVAARSAGARLIGISTDYVFDGKKSTPYLETDLTAPSTVYGMSKLAGERAIAEELPDQYTIVRIAWLYGQGGPSFVHTMLKLGADSQGEPLKVVDDQLGNPTSTLAVSRLLLWLLDHPVPGVLHGSCEGEASWYEFAGEIFRLRGLRRAIRPCRTEEFPRPALRPANSRLDKARLRSVGYIMPDWHRALEEFLSGKE